MISSRVDSESSVRRIKTTVVIYQGTLAVTETIIEEGGGDSSAVIVTLPRLGITRPVDNSLRVVRAVLPEVQNV
ncbi:hypothetical protein NPIL_88781 [Nephila pilipes]|uniref:Uncharacterized protein n=1 Tax=Nephila pilipes TaxID=299642 RepID=A0A8X6N4K5_NEPPI|nr:hypothetical protein NPIL_88781 [Nephila pilipes]